MVQNAGNTSAVPAASRTALLQRVPLFAGLPPALLGELARRLRPLRFRSGTAIFHVDDDGSRLYIIVQGAVKIFAPSPDGREVVLAILRAGEVFGEMSLLGEERRSASASTLSETDLVGLSRHDFEAVLERYPAATHAILNIVAQRLRKANQALMEAYLLDVPGRLARRLLALADEHGEKTDEGIEIGLRMSQQDLASMIGASRVAVNKQLQAWRQKGLVEVRRQRVTICRPDELRKEFVWPV